MEFDEDTLISASVMDFLRDSDVDIGEIRLNQNQRELLLMKLIRVKADAYSALHASPEFQIGVMVVQSRKTGFGLIRLLIDLVRYRRAVRGGKV